MASSCRRPEHSAPPEVVSKYVCLKLSLLTNANANVWWCKVSFKTIFRQMPPGFRRYLQSV